MLENNYAISTLSAYAAQLIPARFTVSSQVFRISITGTQEGTLDEPPGVALRDGLGKALFDLSSACHHDNWSVHCLYCRLFRPRQRLLTSNGSVRIADLPPAFVVEVLDFPPSRLTQGMQGHIAVTLFTGETEDMLPLHEALVLTGERGIGRPHAQFSVYPASPLQQFNRDKVLVSTRQYQNSPQVRIQFQTPMFIRQQDKRCFGLTFGELLGAILNRLHHGLAHHIGEHDIADRTREIRQRLIEEAARVQVRAVNLTWLPQERIRFHRQRQTLSGFMGTIEYAGTLSPFWALLEVGRLAHIGYGTTFDLGRYTIWV